MHLEIRYAIIKGAKNFIMKDALGISQDSYDELLTKFTTIEIFQFLSDYGQGELSLYYYADRIGGSFIKPKYRTDLIANAIFNTLPAHNKMKLYEYFNWLANNPE